MTPEEFDELAEEAEELGFAGVMSGPLVRSSYRAGRLYRQAMAARGEKPVTIVTGYRNGTAPAPFAEKD